MRYFQFTDENGTVERLDSCESNVSGGTEISADTYYALLRGLAPVLTNPIPDNGAECAEELL